MKRGEARPTRFAAMCLFSVSTSSPSQTPCQVVARAKRKYAHRGVPVQVGLIWSSGDKYHNTAQNKGNKTHRRKRKLAKKKHQIHFAALLVKLQVNMTAELCSLFQETHFAWQLLPLFVLIDKKLRQFLRARTSNTSRRANRVGPGDSLFFIFFFLSSNDDQYVVFPTHSRNHPILPPLNTQTRI